MKTYREIMRRPLRSDKRGSGEMYVPLVCIFAFIILIAAYIELKTYIDKNSTHGTLLSIGTKQKAVIDAVREGERKHTYAEQSVRLATQITAHEYVCGAEYASLRMVGTGSCPEPLESFFLARLNEIVTKYPDGSLSGVFPTVTVNTGTSGATSLHVEGTVHIPIAIGALPASVGGGSFVGFLGYWPMDSKKVISDFGKRGSCTKNPNDPNPASCNHGGLDIAAPVGTQVHSLTSGFAWANGKNDDQIVHVQIGDVEWQYQHIEPAAGIPREGEPHKAIARGEIIGAVLKHHRAESHLHLAVKVNSITNKRMTDTFGLAHFSGRYVMPTGVSYGTNSGGGDKAAAYLDPVCFFDKGVIEPIMTATKTLTATTFEPCNAYEQAFGLSAMVKPIAEAEFAAQGTPSATPANTQTPPTTPEASATQNPPSTDPNAPTTTPAADPKNSKEEKIKRTYANLEKLGTAGGTNPIMTDITQIANDAKIPPALLFALITQESEGLPSAISPTGAAGLVMFTYGTAADSTYKTDTKLWEKRGTTYDDIFQKLKPCSCADGSEKSGQCINPACTPTNDDRFDPRKNAQASARYIASEQQTFSKYEQRDAFAIAAYNAGDRVVLMGIAAAGGGNVNTQVTWPDVKAAIWSLSESIITRSKKCELLGGKAYGCRSDRGYVDAVLLWYQEWGGATYAGSSATSDVPGYYDVRLSISTSIRASAGLAMRTMQQKIPACEDKACIDKAVKDAAHANGLTAEVVDLTKQSACLSDVERAEAIVSRDIQECKRGPDKACYCPFSGFKDVDARFTIAPDAVRLTEYESKPVPDRDASASLVFSANDGYDKSAYHVSYLDAKNELVVLAESAIFTTKDGALTFPTQVDYPKSLWKPDLVTGLAFSEHEAVSDETLCVSPPRPEAYCLTGNDIEPVAFFVDMQAHSKPDDAITPYSVHIEPDTRGFSISSLTSTGTNPDAKEKVSVRFIGSKFRTHTVIHNKITTKSTDGKSATEDDDDYIFIRYDETQEMQNALLSYFGLGKLGDFLNKEEGAHAYKLKCGGYLYEITYTRPKGAAGSIALFDSNLRETKSIDTSEEVVPPEQLPFPIPIPETSECAAQAIGTGTGTTPTTP